jgi:hypothetical protein
MTAVLDAWRSAERCLAMHLESGPERDRLRVQVTCLRTKYHLLFETTSRTTTDWARRPTDHGALLGRREPSRTDRGSDRRVRSHDDTDNCPSPPRRQRPYRVLNADPEYPVVVELTQPVADRQMKNGYAGNHPKELPANFSPAPLPRPLPRL